MASRTQKAHGIVATVVVLLAAFSLAACGGGSGDVDPGNAADAPDFSAAIEAAPPALAALYAKGGVIEPGGLDAYEEQIAELEGYPIVVNNWASWCGPCREEFPHLQEQVAERGAEVAFLGVDVEDSDEAAETFLSGHPLPYPSFSDPDRDISSALAANFGTPSTVFYNPAGEITYVKTGVYTSADELAADIDRYAIEGRSN